MVGGSVGKWKVVGGSVGRWSVVFNKTLKFSTFFFHCSLAKSKLA